MVSNHVFANRGAHIYMKFATALTGEGKQRLGTQQDPDSDERRGLPKPASGPVQLGATEAKAARH
jgi:hypothetical protein